jgi:hypothetical protein
MNPDVNHQTQTETASGQASMRRAWGMTKDAIDHALPQRFLQRDVNHQRINRALIFLIPKTEAAVTPWRFPARVSSKLSHQDLDKVAHLPATATYLQTVFIMGRSISQKFVFAMELVKCCHKRRVPIKLDFAKAFDSVNSAC